MSNAKLLITLAGLLVVAGLAGCEAPDQPALEQQVSRQARPEATGTLRDLQQGLQDEIRRSELAEKEVRRMQAELDVLQDQNADLTQQLLTVETAGLDLAGCRRENKDLESRLKQERQFADNFCAEQTKLIEKRFEQEAKNETLRDLNAELTAVEQNLKTTRDQLAQANSQIANLQTELRSLEKNYSEFQAKADRVGELEENLSILRAEKAIFEQSTGQATDLERQLLDTRRQLAEALTKVEEMEARLQAP